MKETFDLAKVIKYELSKPFDQAFRELRTTAETLAKIQMLDWANVLALIQALVVSRPLCTQKVDTSTGSAELEHGSCTRPGKLVCATQPLQKQQVLQISRSVKEPCRGLTMPGRVWACLGFTYI